jgi:hypothetical protein
MLPVSANTVPAVSKRPKCEHYAQLAKAPACGEAQWGCSIEIGKRSTDYTEYQQG